MSPKLRWTRRGFRTKRGRGNDVSGKDHAGAKDGNATPDSSATVKNGEGNDVQTPRPCKEAVDIAKRVSGIPWKAEGGQRVFKALTL